MEPQSKVRASRPVRAVCENDRDDYECPSSEDEPKFHLRRGVYHRPANASAYSRAGGARRFVCGWGARGAPIFLIVDRILSSSLCLTCGICAGHSSLPWSEL
jgi:hypothetical protein